MVEPAAAETLFSTVSLLVGLAKPPAPKASTWTMLLALRFRLLWLDNRCTATSPASVVPLRMSTLAPERVVTVVLALASVPRPAPLARSSPLICATSMPAVWAATVISPLALSTVARLPVPRPTSARVSAEMVTVSRMVELLPRPPESARLP